MKQVGIALALGDIYDKAGAGSLILPLDGAIARLDATVSSIDFDRGSEAFIVCSAGYSKNRPSIPQSERQVSLANQLLRYICTEKQFLFSFFSPYSVCWGTRHEVRLGIRLALKSFATRDEDIKLVIASNLTHLPRIWLYTKMYTPSLWNVKLVYVRHQFSLFSHLLEFPKLIRDIIYFGRVLYRLKRRKNI